MQSTGQTSMQESSLMQLPAITYVTSTSRLRGVMSQAKCGDGARVAVTDDQDCADGHTRNRTSSRTGDRARREARASAARSAGASTFRPRLGEGWPPIEASSGGYRWDAPLHPRAGSALVWLK